MDELIQIYDRNILLLDNYIEKGIIPDPDLADVWVINHPDPSKVKAFLRKTIRSKDLRVYLKPIFLKKEFEKGYEYLHENLYIKELCDGYIANLQIFDKIQLIDRISHFVSKYANARNQSTLNQEDFILQVSFDYYYTRQKQIVPIRSHVSLSGYIHPRIEAHFLSIDDGDKYSRLLLREAYYENLLTRDYIDTLHLCHRCGGGFLNYREVCPKCKSHNLRVMPLIHHFRCAYIGPKDDFMYKDQMICPKCSSLLLNLGVDYDQPGFTFVCKEENCKHEFQHPPILASCVECNTDQSPDQLIVRKVYKYSFTEKGVQHFLLHN